MPVDLEKARACRRVRYLRLEAAVAAAGKAPGLLEEAGRLMREANLTEADLEQVALPPEADETPAPGPELRRNPRFGGLELLFPARPADAVVARLKGGGWRWRHKGGYWYARESEAALALANSLGAREAAESI